MGAFGERRGGCGKAIPHRPHRNRVALLMFALLATLAEAGPGKLFAGFISLVNLQTYGKRYIDARKQDKKVKSGKDKSKPSFLSNAEKKASMAGVIAAQKSLVASVNSLQPATLGTK